MRLSLIVALSKNGVIGKDGKLPWPKIPEDMANFKRLTMGHSLIMGRKTWDSIDKRLSGRKHVVLSRSMKIDREWLYVARTPMGALDEAFAQNDHAFVIGGAEIYRLLGPLCDEAYVTMINRDIEGDTHFPDAGMCDGWSVVDKRQLAPDVFYSHRIRKSCPKPTTNAT